MESITLTHIENLNSLTLRRDPCLKDMVQVKNLILSTDMFFPYEINVAIELLDDRLKKGRESEYLFVFADIGDETVGFTCYGSITVADKRYDLYWIVIKREIQGKGIGSLLLNETEKHIRELSGQYIYIETSSKDIYKLTRNFYRKHNYYEVARIPHYYADNDDKLVFMKNISTPTSVINDENIIYNLFSY